MMGLNGPFVTLQPEGCAFNDCLPLLSQGGFSNNKHNGHKKTPLRHGSRGGEMGEFSPPPPLFLSPLLSFFFSYPSNIEIIFDFSD